MPFPVTYRGEVPAPRAAERSQLLGGVAVALRREGARHIQVDGERLEFHVKWLAAGGSSPISMADWGRVQLRVGPGGPVLDYEVSVRRWAVIMTAASFLWLGGVALVVGAPFAFALTFAAIAWTVMIGSWYVTARSRFAGFLRRLAADPRPPTA